MATVRAKSFFEDYVRFRKIMGDRRNTLMYMEEAFAALYAVYLFASATSIHTDTTKEDIDRMDSAMDALLLEWERRKMLMIEHRTVPLI